MPVGLPLSYYKYNKLFIMFDKINLPIAREKKTKFNLRNHIIATGEMGQLFPIRQIEVVPGDEFDIDVEMFSRTAPLVVPTFGSVKFTTRAFFVPNRLSYGFWNEFITRKTVLVNGAPYQPVIPQITNSDIVGYFMTLSYGLMTQVSNSSVPHDVTVVSPANVPIGYFVFTNKGRYWLKVFNALGYKFNFVYDTNNTLGDFNVSYSMLPLLAFLRVYFDWYLPSQYIEGSPLTDYLNEIKLGHTVAISSLYHVLDQIQLTYDGDYFTSAWRFPLAPLSTPNSTVVRSDELGGNYHVDSSVNGNTYSKSVVLNNNTSTYETNWAITMAQKLANYIIRNNYAGSRAVEQLLARFGVKVPDMEIQRSVHFGTSVSNLQIMDVTNTAESQGAPLGTYGAKAIGFDKGKKMHISCKEHGFIILLCSIMPETSQGFEGLDRSILKTNIFDFFTPEFDRSIMQPIYSGELISNYKGSSYDNQDLQDYVDNNAKPKNIFGFVPYATEYKVAHDNVIGDFNIPHLAQSLDCYHLFRELYPDFTVLAQHPNFLYFNSEQYNRIFNVTNSDQDHFYMIYRIKVAASRPMLSISDSIPFQDDDIEHRNSVDMKANGASFNN